MRIAPSPEGSIEQLEIIWKQRLVEAERRYLKNPSPETRVQFKRVLVIFKDLVLRGKIPGPDAWLDVR